MRNKGWIDMDAQDRFSEADKRMLHLVDRKAYLKTRNAPQDWLAHYDEAIMYAVHERARFESDAKDMEDARRRREYERMDIYGR